MAGYEAIDGEIDVRGLVMLLWRRRGMILGFVILFAALAALALSFVAPRYTARALVLVQSGAPELPGDLTGIAAPVHSPAPVILSEIEIMRSRMLTEQIVQRLDLMNDPEFNAHAAAGGGGAFKNLSVYGSELEKLPPEIAARHKSEVITAFLENLNVRQIEGSFAIQVEFTAHDPAKAALVANTLADAYIAQRLEGKSAAAKNLTGWLDKRLVQLREQVRGAEAALQEYRAAHNIVEGTDSIVSKDQLAELRGQLNAARAAQTEAEARVQQVRAAAKDPAKLEAASALADTGLVRELRLSLLQLQAQQSELSSRYGPKHPKMTNLSSELGEVRGALQGELSKIVKNVEAEAEFARAKTASLEEALQAAGQRRDSDSSVSVRLEELEREAASSRLIYERFLETGKRAGQYEELQTPEARVISYAAVPDKPGFPNKALLIVLSGIMGLFLALSLVLLLEKMDNAFRSAVQLEGVFDYPCYGLIPAAEGVKDHDLAAYVIGQPSSVVAEAVRSLRAVLNLRSPFKKPKVITVTSSFPGEGKTTLSLWLARLAAKSGEKVILIDADLRRPNVHKQLGTDNALSLAEYLTDQKALEQVVRKDPASGLHMIYGRSVTGSALDLIASEKMKKLVDSLRRVYDLVIIDSPAALAVSDARLLARMSDHTLYAVAWNATPREVVASGVKQFTDMDYQALSFVLTNVDVKRHVRYGYGDSVYYYGRYKEAYAA